MEKPIIIRIEETKASIANAITDSKLGIELILPVVEEIHKQCKELYFQELERQMEAYRNKQEESTS